MRSAVSRHLFNFTRRRVWLQACDRTLLIFRKAPAFVRCSAWEKAYTAAGLTWLTLADDAIRSVNGLYGSIAC
ncbi:hypothetical protein EGK14_13430 [Erwinia sp. 198]|nr:hypothetical protein EGK14_13430 [Erwinia sp. 198]